MNRPDFPHILIDGGGNAHATLSLRVAFFVAPPARPPEGRCADFPGEGARATRSDAYTRAD
jgi:hypothetical protein